jgi:glucosamine--fructose-6-phosphate aminotransferase (isomerizing)
MCGIVAVLRRPSKRSPPSLEELLRKLEQAHEAIQGDAFETAASLLADVDLELRGTPGLRCMLSEPAGHERIAAAAHRIWTLLAGMEARMEESLDYARHGAPGASATREHDGGEGCTAARLSDLCWAIEHDRVGTARAVAQFLRIDAGEPSAARANLDAWWSIQVALASLGRLEVRGRDSAGLHVLVTGHSLEEEDLAGRDRDLLCRSGSVRLADGCVGFVYKAAAEIGELGDNVRALRSQIGADALLAGVLSEPEARCSVIAHTRWASVGVISEPNAHPLDSAELGRPDAPYVVAALNGDIDNHRDLVAAEGLLPPPGITTDAKVIPTLVSRAMSSGATPEEAFLNTVSRFDGSVAIAAQAACAPDELYLALRGSGQALCIGLAEDAFVVASEPYGLVEEASTYLRMDGEATGGEAVTLHRAGAGSLSGVSRRRYGGNGLPVGQAEVVNAEITTRDIDRGGFKHFLLKELHEAPDSLRKTIRGRVVRGESGRLECRVGEGTVPPALAAALAEGTISKVTVIGQGTAAVAARAVAAAIGQCLPQLAVKAMPATELSGFGLCDDMSDTLVVAVSQSGTTTDTNRTVDLARTRGAHVISIVNRRNSDLAAKSHGVLHTSDGRDVEMSVASTKAFYAQVAAGWVLAGALARAGGVEPAHLAEVLEALCSLPEAMTQVLAQREHIGQIAARVAPPRRFWAVVGSGPDQLAAAEVRIKLSELCYRSISQDTTEDKKHIDLSSEPMVLVCAAGLNGSTAEDTAKELAIYRAHRAAPVLITRATEAARFGLPADELIVVPDTHPSLAFVLAAMAGHIFGYEAAVAIDALALPLRAARALIQEAAFEAPDDPMPLLAARLPGVIAPFEAGLRNGSYNGNLEARTAVEVVSLLRYAIGALPLDVYESETGKIASPATLLDDLVGALSRAIDELTRPVDAIKHQAKTVTVGITRSEETLLAAGLVQATLAAGPAPDTLGYRALKTLAALDEAVAEVLGYTRYRIDWAPGAPTAAVIDQGGSLLGVRSRTASDPRLRGTKHRAAEEREVTVAVGASDGRELVMVPEAKGTQVTGLTLLHVRFHERLSAEAAKRVLLGYRTRYAALSDAVTETEPAFDDALLVEVAPIELLTTPVYVLAERWRRGR